MLRSLTVLAMVAGCRPQASSAPEQAQLALGKVGAAYTALALAYQAAVETRVRICQKQGLGPSATEAERVTCMGELASDGKITLTMIRVKDLYDETADVLEQLSAELAALEQALRKEPPR